MRRLIAALVVLLGLSLLAWAFVPKPIGVDVSTVVPRTIDVVVEEEGIARIREVFVVSATTGGKLHRVDLHAGDTVVAGKTVVASIGPADPALLDSRARAIAEAGVAAALAAVDLARAQLAQAQATLQYTSSEAARTQQLFDHATVPRRVLDTALLQQKTSQAALDSAAANLNLRQQELESAKAVLETSTRRDAFTCCMNLLAPVSGQVLRVVSEDEQVVLPGAPILEIGNSENLEIAVELLSRDAVRIGPGAQAEIIGWGGPALSARVVRIEPSARTKVSALGIEEQRVEVVLVPTGNAKDWRQLGHGYRVIARVSVWRGENVLSIPVGALFRDGPDWATFVVRQGRAVLRRITIGQRSDSLVQVTGGLEPGEVVIMHPNDAVLDGVRVTVTGQPD